VRAVVQRVSRACVRVAGESVGAIGLGLLVFLGVAREDDPAAEAYVADKIAGLRVFPDAAGRMELSVVEAGGAVLVVSQFTLYGDARKGRRPSYTRAAAGAEAEARYEAVCARLRDAHGLTVATGRFGADMEVEAVGAGPVTILLDSERLF
jgi:D-tyrosyl-tRNA(Tyr) deacylase